MQPLNFADIQPFLDSPEQLANQSISFQISVANYLPTPRKLLEVLVNSSNSQVAETARLHVDWAGEIIENWEEVADAVLRNAQLEQNDRLAVELLKFAPVPDYFLSEWVPANPLLEGLHNPYLPNRFRIKIMERLAREPSLEPRLQMAELADAPLAILEQLAGDLELPVRLAVRYNPNCPTELILRVESQHNAAQDWNTEPQQLAILAESSWPWVRLAVAQNPHTPPEVLVKLAGDAYEKIQLAVARNPASPEGAIALLANHSENSIRDAVAKHPNASEATLLQLLPSYSNVIINRNNLPISVLEQLAGDRNLYYSLLKERNLPGTILAQMLDSSSESNRAKIAEHPQVLVSTLEQLARDADPKVRLAVAQNLNTPDPLRSQLLQQLVLEGEEYICNALAVDSNIPVPLLEQIGDRELYSNKLRFKLHRVLAGSREEKEFSAEFCMGNIRKILSEFAATLDIDSWMDLLERYRFYRHLVRVFWRDRQCRELWAELLPTVPESALEEIINNLSGVIFTIELALKEKRSVAIALVGNPNTPTPLREQLLQQLTVPQNKGWELLMPLAFNPAIPEAQRIEYLQEAIASDLYKSHCGFMRQEIAKNPNTPLFILEKLGQQGAGMVQAIAANPNAPVSILRQAAQEDNSSTLKLLAKNPSTPTDILEELALNKGKDGVREEAFKNPNLDPLIIYQFELESQAAEEIAKANELFASRLHSPYAIAQVLRNGDLASRMKIARDYRTPVNILEQLTRDADESIRVYLAENPNLPLTSRLELTRDPSFKVRRALARKQFKRPTPVEVLEQLANDESEGVRALVAENPETPAEILVQLANNSNREIKNKVVANRNTPVEILERLGLQEGIFSASNPNTPGSVLAEAASRGQSNPKVLTDLLRHPVEGSQMPASTLARLANHSPNSIRYLVAQHRNTPPIVLEQLASNSDLATIRIVASKANTPANVLERLAEHQDYTVRYNVALNPNTPDTALELLARFNHSEANAPSATKNALKTMMAGADKNQIRIFIASNPRTPLAALEMLANREFLREENATPSTDHSMFFPRRNDEEVLEALARNPNLTPELLERLARDPSPNVRSKLIHNPNITLELWALLARDEDVAVRLELAERSHCPITILELLASDEDKDVRQKVAANRNTPAPALEILATDADAAVRTAVAANRNTPAPALEQLAQDRRVEVRLAVSRNPNKPASVGESLRELQPPTRQVSPTLRGLSRIYNPNTDDLPSLLSEYVQSSRPFVRFVALMHPLTPAEALRQGSESASWLERYAVANNPATPPEIRQLLAEDSNRIVRATGKAYL